MKRVKGLEEMGGRVECLMSIGASNLLGAKTMRRRKPSNIFKSSGSNCCTHIYILQAINAGHENGLGMRLVK